MFSYLLWRLFADGIKPVARYSFIYFYEQMKESRFFVVTKEHKVHHTCLDLDGNNRRHCKNQQACAVTFKALIADELPLLCFLLFNKRSTYGYGTSKVIVLRRARFTLNCRNELNFLVCDLRSYVFHFSGSHSQLTPILFIVFGCKYMLVSSITAAFESATQNVGNLRQYHYNNPVTWQRAPSSNVPSVGTHGTHCGFHSAAFVSRFVIFVFSISRRQNSLPQKN